MASSDDVTSVAILGGCGHVGLPLGIVLAHRGHDVMLVDTSKERREMVAGGEMPFTELGADELLPKVLQSGRLNSSGELAAISGSEVVIVTIGTPVDEFLNPELKGFDAFIGDVIGQMRDGQLLVIRSTIFPGVAERVASFARDSGKDIDVTYCPERIAQGYAIEELRRLPQLVSGGSDKARDRASAFFSTIVDEVVEVTMGEAELAKLFSNSYRYINFAIANQFYMLSERFGVDYKRVKEAATHGYPRLRGLAMSGFAAGPCLVKDTMQLSSFNHFSFPLGQAAMTINEGLPSFLVDNLEASRGGNLKNETVAILGMAFKGNSDDARSSLSYKLKKVLELHAGRVMCTDPYVPDDSLDSLEDCLEKADVLVIGSCHEPYKKLDTNKPIVDVFGFVEREAS
jgi:UDP-N-acetyl-D-mannosaminuronic acid dehydrogenase